MVSDKDDLEFNENNDSAETSSGFTVEDDVVDLDHEAVSSLSAADDYPEDYSDDLSGDLDVDITGDENIDFADEDSGDREGKGGGMKKMLAPVLVLLIAAGAGGFIVMNPQILGGSDGASSKSPMEYVAGAPVQDITENTTVAQAQPQADMFSNTPPQPTATQNEVPRAPEAQMDLTEQAELTPPPAFPDMGDTASEMTEQGSADQSADVADSQAAPPAQEADSLAQELYNLKFTDEEPASGTSEMAEAEAEITPPQPESAPEPVAPLAMSPPPVEETAQPAEEFRIAQADVTEVPDAPPPPKLPEQTAPAPAPAPAARTPSTFESPMDNATGSTAAPVARPDTSSASDVYYDGRIPTGPMATEAGPRKIDPVMEPAQQFVVVKKSHEAGDFESVLVSANRALELKRYDSALEMFEQLYQKNPRDPRVLMGKAVAQQNLGMTEAAIMTYEQVMDVNPRNTDAMLNMLGLLRKQYPEVALRRLMDLYERYPDNAGIAAQIGVTQADLSHYGEALRFLGIASSLEPQNAQHAFNMAIIADRAGDTAGAIKYYETALELDAVYSSGRSIPRESVYDRLSVLRRR